MGWPIDLSRDLWTRCAERASNGRFPTALAAEPTSDVKSLNSWSDSRDTTRHLRDRFGIYVENP